ncbi:MAG: sugar-binding transcriptional regulator [Roseiflexaceae bacterium]|nr:sugar-binding transcriptional regulator [Roseiflexaceae bacterium]
MAATDYDNNRTDLDLLARVAEGYYIEHKTQGQLAEQLGISSSTVSRLLNRAREEGIVRISIVRPHARSMLLEHTLRTQFGIEALIAATGAGAFDDEALRRTISVAAAPAIDGMIKPGMQIGVGRGRTVAALAAALQPYASPRPITIVQVMGEYDTQHSSARAGELARLLSEMYSGTSYYLNAPALVENPALAEALLHTPGVRQVLPMYDRLDMVLMGVGPLRGSPLDDNGLLPPDVMLRLEAAGAVGDICGHFFDAEGRLVDHAYPGRVIAIGWEQLRRCTRVVAVAAGDNKVIPLRALLDAGLIHVLVTDEHTARQIVGAPQRSAQSPLAQHDQAAQALPL